MKKTVEPGRLQGEALIPASKSHTIRALLIAAMADGVSRVVNPLDSADTQACVATCRALGAEIDEVGSRPAGFSGAAASDASAAGRSAALDACPSAAGRVSEATTPRELRVRGIAGRLRAPREPIDVLNSGTTLYLAAGLAALSDAEITFDGDHQIRARPIGPLLESLEQLGARARALRANGCAPVSIRGPLKGGRTSIACPTSQYLSSLLLACPLARGESRIEVTLLNERPYAEMTLRWLDEQGIRYERHGFERFTIPGEQRYRPFTKAVPGDFSSATFLLCAAAITGSTLRLRGLDMADSQGDKAVVGMLERMGCGVRIEPDAITIEGAGPGGLAGRDLDLNATPDALPALAATACFARGTTRLLNVPQARLKETDRITVMREELSKMGARVEELPDGLVVAGAGALHGAPVDGRSDHRAVMSLAIAALGADGATTIETAEAAGVTFPGFFELLESLRAR